MNVQTLTNLLLELMEKHGKDVEVRIGDQIEAGPYSHDRVGGVWTNREDNAGGVHYVILCAEDSDWEDEIELGTAAMIGGPSPGEELPLLWKPPAPYDAALMDPEANR